MKKWRQDNLERERARSRKLHSLSKSSEMVIVAQSKGDDVPRCRADLTPNLLVVTCAGKLQIDHMNGGGNEEGPGIRRKNVLNGTRDLSDLRVLCERHNFEYALQREDTTGGSDPKDWEE